MTVQLFCPGRMGRTIKIIMETFTIYCKVMICFPMPVTNKFHLGIMKNYL